MKNFAHLLVALILFVGGCSSGESIVEHSRKDRTRPPLPEPPATSGPAAWSDSAEYRASNGLRMIRAAQGYAARTTGAPGGRGKTVAVLDTPVDLSHDDLDGTTYKLLLDEPNFSDPNVAHGTHVAGTVAARRDGSGVHGVAYNARLIGIGVLRSVPRQRQFVSPLADSPSDIAAGIASAAGLRREFFVYDDFGNPVYETDPFTGFPVTDPFTGLPVQASKLSNPAAKADIMNMSLGSPDPSGLIWQAMVAAARSGRIMVAALGNCGQPFSNPQCRALNDSDGIGPSSAPAGYAYQPGVAGFVIAVGSLDERGTRRASFSNACGEAQRYCLFAPGSQIQSSVPGNGFDRMSGTSMASPHVAGSAAVVWAAFPNKSGDEIVTRLLETARPIDGRAISYEFGHGALDLEAALRPVGTRSVPLPKVGLVRLPNSFVNLPPGFGAPTNSVLADTIVYDQQGFPFLHDLTSAFRPSTGSADSFSRWFLVSLGRRSTTLPMGSTSWLRVVPHSMTGRNDRTLDGIYVSFQPLPSLTIAVGNINNPTGSLDSFAFEQTHGAMLQDDLQDDLSASPFVAAAGGGVGLKIDWRWGQDTAVDVVGVDGTGYFGSTSAQLTSVGLKRRIGNNFLLGTRYGTLRERGSRIGIVGKGAFAGIPASTTYFADIGVRSRMSEDVALFGGLSYGVTGGVSSKRASLVSKWGSIRTNSFMIGSEIRHLWLASDRLVATASSPFRTRDASATVIVPSEEIEDGVVRFTPQTVSLAPQGREGRFQLIYETSNDGDIAATVGAYARIQPNHDLSAKPEFGVAAKIHVSF